MRLEISKSKKTCYPLNNRFLRQHRLLTAKEYQAVFQSGCRIYNQQLTLLARNNQLAYSRLGLIVAKKQVAKATKRNRFKRLIRESFRGRQEQLQGLDIVVLVNKASLMLDNHELAKCLDYQWLKLLARCKKA